MLCGFVRCFGWFICIDIFCGGGIGDYFCGCGGVVLIWFRNVVLDYFNYLWCNLSI